MQPATLIYTGGTIFTADRPRPRAEALAICGDRITAVGSRQAVMACKGPQTRVIDLKGRALLPGFNEAHAHLVYFGLNLGLNLGLLDASPQACAGIAVLKEELATRALTLPPGTWIEGWGYDDTRYIEGRHPNRHDLDAAAPDHPVNAGRSRRAGGRSVCAGAGRHRPPQPDRRRRSGCV